MAQAKETGREWTGNDSDEAFNAAGTVFGGNTLLDRLIDENGVQTKAEVATGTGGVLTVDINGTDVATTRDETIEVTDVTLNKASASVKVGATTKLTAKVVPDTATNKAVTFKSSDEAVATVAADGTVTGVKEGTAEIAVITTDQEKTATAKVTVTAA